MLGTMTTALAARPAEPYDDMEGLERRLEEGSGDLVHHAGFDEAGRSLGLSPAQLEGQLEGFRRAAERLGATCHVLARGGAGAWVLVRRVPGGMEAVAEVRVAVVGNVDAGKSTMLGVLTKGVLDDGRGLARVNLFRHKHELDTGRTSSIGAEILGFDAGARPIYGAGPAGPRLTWEQVCARAHRLVGFIDLAGHEKYLKTTMFGLTGCAPDYSLLMVGANAGLVGMSKEHLTLSFALGVPVAIVVTKVDMAPAAVLEETMRQIFRVLKSPACKRVPVLVKTLDEAVMVTRSLVAHRLCPIFQVSNVSGEGLDRLRLFLNVVPPASQRARAGAPLEFEIVETFAVPGVGTVVSGTMISGRAGLGQQVFLGPDSLGAWTHTQIKGIHRKRVPVGEAWAGQSVSFALKKIKRSAIHKGMVLLPHDPATAPASPLPALSKACWEFEAEVIVLFHSTTMGPKYQAMLHSGVIRQTVAVVRMQQEVMRTGDRATVRFRFVRHPEYVRVGARLVFREGRTKGVGRITGLFD